MHEYDVTLKMLLRGSARMAFQALTGGAVEKWLDVAGSGWTALCL